MLKIKNLFYGYDKKSFVLHNINLEIPEGVTLLVGENGSGKSTLFKTITCDLPNSGEVFLDGANIKAKDTRSNIAYLPQIFAVYADLKIKDILFFIAQLKGIKKDCIEKEISFAVKKTNIVKYLNVKFKKCSIGTQRRVGIASLLLNSPRLILLDEPTAGIDPKERHQFYQIIKESFKGKIVLISTHILDDIELLADNVIMLSNGQVTYDGSYQIFLHSLDNRIFFTNQNKSLLKRQFPDCIILAETVDGDNAMLRIVIPEAATGAVCSLIPTVATIEDLWLFYQARQDNA